MFTQFDEFFTQDQGEGKPKFNIDEDNEFFNLMNNTGLILKELIIL